MTMPRRLPLLTVYLVLVIGLIAGCGEEETLPCGPDGTGVIRGAILAAGQPVSARIVALRVRREPGDPQYSLLQGFADSTGVYSIEVPAGDYLLAIDGFACFSYYHQGTLGPGEQADTLSVARGETVTADLIAGAMRVDLTGPDELEGRTAVIRLESVDSACSSTAERATMARGTTTFYLRRVLPGTYRLSLDLLDLGQVWLPGTTTVSEADTVVVRPGRERLYETGLPQAAILRGTVTGSWQELGQAPPRVNLAYSDRPGVFAITVANSVDGSFEFHVYGRARGVLNVQIDSITRWYGGDSQQTATPIELEPGRTVQLDLRESGVAGWLNAEPSPDNSNIWLTDASGATRGRCIPDGPGGFFRMSNLAPGTYFLHIPAGPTWIDQWYDQADSLAAATPVVIADEGQIVWLSLDLEKGGKIEGRLFRDDGAPAYGVPLDLVGPTGSQPIRRVRSNGDGGAFAFPALPDGDYRIVAHPNEIDVPVWYPGVLDPQLALVISIRDHAEVTEVFIDIP
jgi:hypothetical protein